MIRVEAPAKLNLYLHVTGRRADGYHELDSLVTFTALVDTLEIVPADALSLTVSGPCAEALGTGDNLATRAAAALAERLGRRACVRIALLKRIPVAAGLGGGSADAAAVLRGLARLWGLGAAHVSDFQDVALGLGADVPVCLDSRAAYMAGIGETLSAPPPLPACGVLLVNPGVPVPTGAIFAARQGPFSAANRFRETPSDASALTALLRSRRNDLEPPARAQLPEIGRVLDWLGAMPGCLLARMSGSGATCFGLFADEATATQAARAIARENPDWWVHATQLVHGGETAGVSDALGGS
ncbi:MAG: 4-(cytidine 5'-diphospho)-2-C-methyl-D-erythritol kinase [Rhodospirillales bacterium]|nr:4-(cytidine 5'-diphospho)-2-C-methyl-D-erythritol kinase [Rhodospirillales bacterium]